MKLWPAFLLIAQLTCENHARQSILLEASSKEATVAEEQSAENFLVHTGKGVLSLQQKENDFSLQHKLGATLEVRNITGNHAMGFQKTLCYEGVEICIASPASSGEYYWIKEILISSPQYEIGKGVAVGDSIESIVRIYPSLWTCIGNSAKEYMATVDSDHQTIVFSINNNKLNSIRLYSTKP